MKPAIYRQLEAELARAEAVVASDSDQKKVHQPTLEHHRGQALAYRKALTLLAIQENNPLGPIELKRNYTVTVSWRVFLLIVVLAAIAVC